MNLRDSRLGWLTLPNAGGWDGSGPGKTPVPGMVVDKVEAVAGGGGRLSCGWEGWRRKTSTGAVLGGFLRFHRN